ncbi:MAG TPA: GNAT family N-acetyltransferase [Anaerolineales bacterium]|nr:GNAT family N-acetyltransferase [Anaerolineales bacterium]
MEIHVEELEVLHNRAERRFEIWLDGTLCELDYHLQANTMIIHHTGVPAPLEGRGIAGRLTRTALEYAAENALRVIPLCSYVAVYIRRHPQYKRLVNQNG